MTVTAMASALPLAEAAPGASDPGVIVRVAGGASTGVAPNGATVVTASSGNVAAATASAALPAVASVLNYVTGFTVTAGGATSAAIVNVTLVGVLGGTMTFNFGAAAGATVMSTPLVVVFPVPVPATAVNTAITLSMPTLGAGNTNAAVMIHGFKI